MKTIKKIWYWIIEKQNNMKRKTGDDLATFMEEIKDYSSKITPQHIEQAKKINKLSIEQELSLEQEINWWLKGRYDEDPDYLADALINIINSKI